VSYLFGKRHAPESGPDRHCRSMASVGVEIGARVTALLGGYSSARCWRNRQKAVGRAGYRATSTLLPYWAFWADWTRSKTMDSVPASIRIW